MVSRKISDDLKEAALRLTNRGRDSIYNMAAITGLSVSTFYCICCRKLLTGSVAKAEAIGHGWPRTLARWDCDYLMRLARHKSTLFLDEYS